MEFKDLRNSSERLYINIMEFVDIEDMRKLHNEESTLLKLSDINHISEEEQMIWFKKMSISKSSFRYVAKLKSDNAFVGIFRIDNIDLTNRSAYIGADIMPLQRGKGYAKEMFKYFFDYLFNQKGFHRLALVTLETNLVAIGLYKSLGFSIEGKQRESIFRNGEFIDLFCMSILSREFKNN